MNTYDVLKDFGVPVVTFLAGMGVEWLRERRSATRDDTKQRDADKPWFALVDNATGSARDGSELQ
ncbi:MAG TPA: hypothetical protein VM733_00730, partial [Thermoanaerobaculia bacterium]|nr:hypothetical protein [Thermoanaerobaculia bacterium]